MKKKLTAAVLLAALTLTACGGADSGTAAATATPIPDELLNQPAATPEDGAEIDPDMAVDPDAEPTASPAPDAELTALVDGLYAVCPVDLMMMETYAVDLHDDSWTSYLTGLDSEQAAKVDAAVVSESTTGSLAYSLVLARVADEADAQAIADAMLQNIDLRKWVCVMADEARVAVYGDKVLFVMSDSELADVDALMAAAPGVLGGEASYEASRSESDG